MNQPSSAVKFYVSPNGNDRWSGTLPASNRAGKDGPFATIERAQRAVRSLKKRAGLKQAVRIELRGGRYELDKPFTCKRHDSGTPPPKHPYGFITGPECGVTYAGYKAETPVLSGGRRITGWRPTTVRGVHAWVARLPEVAKGHWYFTQLWVNNRRAPRTRLPREGYFRIVEPIRQKEWQGPPAAAIFAGHDRFRFAAGDLQSWQNVSEIEFVAIHFWIEDRIPFRNINLDKSEARLQWKSKMDLLENDRKTGAAYYVENIFEELRQPGQWYLDRPSGQLYYLPRKGETIRNTEIIAPRLKQLLVVEGDLHSNKWVEHIHFEGLTFSHNEWVAGPELHTATAQAACYLGAALSFRHARQCSLRRCRVTHIGSYAIETNDASCHVKIVGNHLTDLAAGGVKIWHTYPRNAKCSPGDGPDQKASHSCRNIVVSDNVIADGGHRWRQAVGVLIGKCSGNQILHNHVHDFDYTGISVGWTWNYEESGAYGNIIEYNHIHDIGRGVLSDLGGIYTLGVSPGTRIRFNLIHDVQSHVYGGRGIYPDAASSDILIENNIVYRTKAAPYRHQYGRNNIVRNNIFAFGGEYQVGLNRVEPHQTFRFERNIVLGKNGGKMLYARGGLIRAVFDHNLYFDLTRKPLDFDGKNWSRWRGLGQDKHSLIADPLFVDPERGDFRLRPGSPAAKIGFVPFDLSNVGPRPPGR